MGRSVISKNFKISQFLRFPRSPGQLGSLSCPFLFVDNVVITPFLINCFHSPSLSSFVLPTQSNSIKIPSNKPIDASHPLSGHRLTQILASYQPTQTHSTPQHPPTLSALLSNLTHFSTPTLAHLLALLCHPTPNNPPHNTSLIIIDSFSTLISNAFPRSVDANATPRKPGGMLSRDPILSVPRFSPTRITPQYTQATDQLQHPTPQPANFPSCNT